MPERAWIWGDWRIASAYHEAGHAVVAIRFHHRVQKVTIRPEPFRYRGRTRIEWSDPRWGGDPIVLMAGYYAERRYKPSTHWHTGSQGDIRDVGDYLLRLGPGKDQSSIEKRAARRNQIKQFTREIIGSPKVWRAIETLAAALLKKDTISGREATKIVKRILDSAPSQKRAVGTRTS